MRNIFLTIVIVVIIFFIANYFIYGTGNEYEYRNEMVSKYCKDMNHSNQKKCNEQYKRAWNRSEAVKAEIIAGWKE